MPKFEKKPVIVEAIRLSREMTIETDQGTVTAHAGDWLVTGVEGEQYPIPHSRFMLTYRPENDEAAEYLEAALNR